MECNLCHKYFKQVSGYEYHATNNVCIKRLNRKKQLCMQQSEMDDIVCVKTEDKLEYDHNNKKSTLEEVSEQKIIYDKKKFSTKFYNKLSDYRKVDRHKRTRFPFENEGLETVNLSNVITLVNQLDTDLCSGCKCKMLFCDYTPFCLYQFSLVRIDNAKIHSVNNIKIVCWNCNSSGYGSIKNSCSRKCHINTKPQDHTLYCETETHIKS